jgi:hypothetical protein
MRSAFAFGIVVVLVGCGGSGNPNIKPGPMPENGTFTGVYFSPQYGEMHMVQNGNAVVGKYKKDERSGKIQGEADGDVMRFEWTEYKAMVSNRPQQSRGHGYFRYMVDASNGDHLLKGRWGLNDDDNTGGEWSAYKSKKGEPDLEHFGGEMPGDNAGDKSSGGDDSGGSDHGSSNGSGDEGDDVF